MTETNMIERPAGGVQCCPTCESWRVVADVFTAERLIDGSTRQVHTRECLSCGRQWVQS